MDGADGADGGEVKLAGGCLGSPCDAPATRTAGRALCVASVAAEGGDGSEALFLYAERRGPSSDPIAAIICTATGMTEAACGTLCAGAGHANARFVPADGRCECSQPIDRRGDLAEELAGIACDPAAADVALTLTDDGSDTYDALQATCREAAGTGTCAAFRERGNEALNLTFSTGIGIGAR